MTFEEKKKELNLRRLRTQLITHLTSLQGVLFDGFVENENAHKLWAKASALSTQPSSSINYEAPPHEISDWLVLQWVKLGEVTEILVSLQGFAALPWAKIQLLPDFNPANFLLKLGDLIVSRIDRTASLAFFEGEHRYEFFELGIDK